MKENRSINAYNSQSRVNIYDDNMNKMHPNRVKMIEIALEFLPYDKQYPLNAIDLGIGTGYFSLEFLKKFPKTHIIGVDGAKAMVEIAELRLKDYSEKFKIKIYDFRNLHEIFHSLDSIDVIFSSYALHHLNPKEKEDLYNFIKKILKPNGWFIYADVIIANNPDVENRFQEIRIDGVLKRTQGKDERFSTFDSTRKFLDDLEEKENDQPLSLSEDIELLKEADFMNIEILWKEYREMVICAQKRQEK
ncbi:MAG: class I SAM-dependent methyltransferase [Candidatus Lokiarchaeota archaeon]|nr:class I SAM-dependent methyltransferase [Candidatus Lokiarchaeota archaeon]